MLKANISKPQHFICFLPCPPTGHSLAGRGRRETGSALTPNRGVPASGHVLPRGFLREPVPTPSHTGWTATETQGEEIWGWGWGERLGPLQRVPVGCLGEMILSELVLWTLWSAVGSVLKMWICKPLSLAV